MQKKIKNVSALTSLLQLLQHHFEIELIDKVLRRSERVLQIHLRLAIQAQSVVPRQARARSRTTACHQPPGTKMMSSFACVHCSGCLCFAAADARIASNHGCNGSCTCALVRSDAASKSDAQRALTLAFSSSSSLSVTSWLSESKRIAANRNSPYYFDSRPGKPGGESCGE